jgi:hypothetical protein
MFSSTRGPATNHSSLYIVGGARVCPVYIVGLTWLKTFDMSLSWIGQLNIKEKELAFEPSVSIYTLFNLANFDIPGNVLSGILTAGPGSANGHDVRDRERIGHRSGHGSFRSRCSSHGRVLSQTDLLVAS